MIHGCPNCAPGINCGCRSEVGSGNQATPEHLASTNRSEAQEKKSLNLSVGRVEEARQELMDSIYDCFANDSSTSDLLATIMVFEAAVRASAVPQKEYNPMIHVEEVPSDRAIWQTDRSKTYQCPVCGRPVYSQYEGSLRPQITCFGMSGHRLTFEKRA